MLRYLQLSYIICNMQIDDLGRTVINFCNIIPGGVVCFFPSYQYENLIYERWKSTGVISRIQAKKKVGNFVMIGLNYDCSSTLEVLKFYLISINFKFLEIIMHFKRNRNRTKLPIFLQLEISSPLSVRSVHCLIN